MDDRLLSVPEAAHIAEKSEENIRRAIRDGWLKATRVGQRSWAIKSNDLEVWINDAQSHKPGPKPKNVKSS
jgi:excisionase family DNA binding protein